MSDRAVAGALVRIQKAKRSARVMKRARGMGLMSHSPSKYGVMYVPAGTTEGVERYGATFKDASEAQRAARKASGYYGRGEYWGKAIGGALGQWSGIPGGGAFLGHVGDKIGDWFKRKFGRHHGRGLYTGHGSGYSGGGLYEGRGAYTPSGHNNSLIMSGQPNIQFSGLGGETSGLTVSHTEYVGDIFGPGNSGYNVTGYPLNPGLQDVFPMLSQFAQNFEEYEFIQLLFHYRSVVDGSSTNNPDGNTGTLVMATDYASSPTLFVDKAQMVSAHGAITVRQVADGNHGVECDPSKNMGSAQKTVRSGLIAGRDISTLDLGRFQIAFSNTPTSFQNKQVGELWVTYTVHLDKPKIFSAAAGNVSQYRAVSVAGTETSSLVFGTGPHTCIQNSLAMLCVNGTNGAGTAAGAFLTFPASANGTFEIKFFFDAGIPGNMQVSAWNAANFITGGNVRLWNDIYASNPGGDGAGGVSWPTATVAAGTVNYSNFCVVIRVKVTAATAGINNTVQIYPLLVAGALSAQTYIEVTEVTPFFAQNSSTDVGLYQNQQGVIVQP